MLKNLTHMGQKRTIASKGNEKVEGGEAIAK
jgi:hypothetical protein